MTQTYPRRFLGYYRFYNAGKFNGQGDDIIMFSFYWPDRQPGSCQSVAPAALQATIQSVETSGYVPFAEA